MSSRHILAYVVLLLAFFAPARIQAGWMYNGNLVNGAIDFQLSPAMVSDGAGGAIISWFDLRKGYETDLYAQRIDGHGNLLWNPNGLPVCTEEGDQLMPVMASDGAGGAIVVWIDTRLFDYDIFIQRLNGAGQALWGRGGSIVSVVQGNQLYPAVINDGEGGAVVAWMSEVLQPDGKRRTDIYAQRLNFDGGWMMWEWDGLMVCIADGYQLDPCLVPDRTHGAIIGWIDRRGNPDYNNIFAQRVTGEGARLWLTNGHPVCQTIADQEGLQMVTDNFGGAIFTWYDHTETNFDIYVSRMDENATPLWGVNGKRITSSPTHQRHPVMCSDGGAGAYVAWVDERYDKDIYIQRVDENGMPAWPGDGIAICDMDRDQTDAAITSDGVGGAIVSWVDRRDDELVCIYAQRINAAGEILWRDDGIIVTCSAGGKYSSSIVRDGAGGAIAAWSDDRTGVTDIYAQWIRRDGQLVGTELQRWAARFSEGRVTVSWTLSEMGEGASFAVSRAVDGSELTFAPLDGEMTQEGPSWTFADASAEPAASYRYRVDVLEGGARRTLFETEAVAVPALPLALEQNHPNPFNPSTEIRFYLPQSDRVSLAVYDVEGTLVRELEDGVRQRGHHSATWNGRNGRGEQVASGVYIYRLRAGKETLSRKMVLLK